MKQKTVSVLLLSAFMALLVAVLTGCGEADDPNVQAVKRVITSVSAAGHTYQTGPLEGGTAVFVDGSAAYWVMQGKVYAANGTAKTWSPSVSYAKSPKITYDSVKAAVR